MNKLNDMNRTIKTKLNRINLIAALFLCSIFSFSAMAQTNPVKVRYDAPRDARLAPDADLLRSGQLLENMASDLNSQLKMPKTLTLGARQCDKVNAFYQPATQSVEICYEILRSFEGLHINDLKDESGKFDRNEVNKAVLGTVNFVLHHELGHALVHLLNLPVTRREEDSVDQLATLISADGTDEEETTALDKATAFLLMAKNANGRQTEFWNQHSLSEQRFYSIICLLYGDSPQKYESVITEGVLPKSRAVRCNYESKMIENSWSRLLAPHIRRN